MKKAISVLLSWVLIVGFAVAMSAIIFGWAIPFVNKISENLERSERTNIYCDTTAIRIESICRVNSNPSYLNIFLINSGNYNIKRLTMSRETTLSPLQSCNYHNLDDNVIEGGTKPIPGSKLDLRLSMTAQFSDSRGNILDCTEIDTVNFLKDDQYVTMIEITPWINIDGNDIHCTNSRITIKDINMLNKLCN